MSAGDKRPDVEDFWNALDDLALDPTQVPILEALRQIDEPLSAIGIVDALDGFLTMWEVAHHLEALQELGVVEPTSAESSYQRMSDFNVPYRLKIGGSGNKGGQVETGRGEL